ncbi:MAG: lipoprotein-releasing ABC transporter permease subunit [Desulfococcaceae bacterium]
MSFAWFVGRRYMGGRRRNAFLSLVTLSSIAGVALGVAVMIVVIAVMSGAEIQLREQLLGVTAHVVVMRHGEPFADHPEVLAKLDALPEVAAATPYLYTQAMLRTPKGIEGAVLRGVDPASAHKVLSTLTPETLAELPGNPQSGRIAGVLLGSELAERLGTETGDIVSLTLPGAGSGSARKVPAMRRFRVAGVFSSGLYEFDKALAYIALEDAQRLTDLGNAVTGIEIRVDDVDRADMVADQISNMLGFRYWAQDWKRMNRNLFSALRLQKTVMFIIMALIVLVAAFNIASTLIMMVMEKKRDIAILKAMGATDGAIRRIFVLKGMVIGGFGAAIGLGIGVALCAVLRRYRIVELPTDVYFFSTLPVSLEAVDVAVILVSTLFICFLATLYPARRASRLAPVEAIRYG